jgi:mono/diheme cytochrome c family protein
MLFAISIGCLHSTTTFESTTKPKKHTQEPPEEPIEDTSVIIDSGEVIDEEGPTNLQDVMDIFSTYTCQGCHGSSGGFRLNESELRNGTSTTTGQAYIVSGSPNDSYLYLKIIDAAGISGQPMPIGGVGLMNEDDIEIVRQWISDGTNGL